MNQETALLDAGEPPPFISLEIEPAFPALLVCDHASNLIPKRLDQLGLGAHDLETHGALDIGAAAVTRLMSAALRLPAIFAGYSRLVVDCNRRLDDPTAFPSRVDDLRVSGNEGLSREQRQARADALYWPYHHAIVQALHSLERLAPAPALIAVHSFTPMRHAVPRPWHLGVLWDLDPRLPEALMSALAGNPAILVGDNEPYSGRDAHDFTVDYHAEAGGLPHVSIEIRQDLIASPDGVEHWANLLVEALRPILSEPGIYTHWTP